MILKPLQSVIVKPVGAKCNLNCDYCFYLEKESLYKELPVMGEDTLDNLLGQLSDQTGPQYSITWQGGEPTLAGLDFFKKAVELQIKYGRTSPKTIGNSLQTNGTLLNDSWVSFLKEYNFLVGLSIDGHEQVHDIYRINRAGKGSWRKARENGRKLMHAGVEVNILSCITQKNAGAADVLYDYFAREGYGWLQVNPVMERDISGQPKDFSVDPKELGRFYCRIFDRWFDDYASGRHAPVIRFIENAFHVHLGFGMPECSFMKECGVYLVVEHNGDVYSCDFFVNTEDKLGNIHDSRLIDMLNSEQQHNFGQRKRNLNEECLTCPWQSMCYGGCPKYRDPVSQNSYFCEAYKTFFAYSNERFQLLAKLWRQQSTGRKGTFDASGYFKA